MTILRLNGECRSFWQLLLPHCLVAAMHRSDASLPSFEDNDGDSNTGGSSCTNRYGEHKTPSLPSSPEGSLYGGDDEHGTLAAKNMQADGRMQMVTYDI